MYQVIVVFISVNTKDYILHMYLREQGDKSPQKTKPCLEELDCFQLEDEQLFETSACMLVDGGTCQVLSSRQLTSAWCLQLWQNSSFKWPLSTTRIYQKCIETVHPGKCDFTVSRTLDMVIKRLNVCCLFFWQQWFFYWTFEAKQNEVSTRFPEWLCFDFSSGRVLFPQTLQKNTHKNFLYVLDNNMHNPCALWPWTLPEIHITGRQLLQTERAALVLTSKTIK